MKTILRKYGVDNTRVFDWGYIDDLIERDQYFDVFSNRKWNDEIFVDMGWWDGSTSISFKELAKDSLDKVIAFEPDINQFCFCQEKLNGLDIPFNIVNKAAWRKEEQVGFSRGGPCEMLKKSLRNAQLLIQGVSLDEFTDER